jgi:hypothetical protein
MECESIWCRYGLIREQTDQRGIFLIAAFSLIPLIQLLDLSMVEH